MSILKFLKCVFGLAAFLAAAPVMAQSLDEMNAGELLAELKQNIGELQDTENRLSDNSAVAEANREEIKALREEAQSLADRAKNYDIRVVQHNRQAEAYNEQCQGKKLPEDIYDQCLDLKANLDTQKQGLDDDGTQLEQDYAAYNTRVAALNDNEDSRVEAANRLLDQYKALDENIRNIQVRLYDISTRRNENGFSEQVRQCTLRDELREVYSCMETAWGG